MEVLSPENYFLQQGILGVIIVVLGGVIIWQQKRLDKKDEEVKELYKATMLMGEKRVTDNERHIQSVVGFGEKIVSAVDAVQKSVDGVARRQEMQGQ